ncbi:hypothetical protein BV20DRAFT_1049218 [Pilatotrama ljubarskyi]|nr:hypothetical protein BV20DRAFT_1049218 [Pilatotrama ljubarskyi]
MDVDKIEWEKSKGSKLVLVNYMFPPVDDRRGLHIPQDTLLQLQDHVPQEEFRTPQYFDMHSLRTLLAVPPAPPSGFMDASTASGPSLAATPSTAAVPRQPSSSSSCGYDTATVENDKFSDDGDSGSVVARRGGRVVAQITRGGGPPDERGH